MGASSMTINGKDKWAGLGTHTYSFSGYGGVENCAECDDFTQTNEYDRRDGLVVLIVISAPIGWVFNGRVDLY